VPVRSKVWVCGRSLVGIVGLNLDGAMIVCLFRVVFCQVEVSALGRSLVLPIVPCLEFDREASNVRRHWPTRGF